MTRRIDLIADGVENPGNARALVDVAQMFGSACWFRRRGRSTPAWDEADVRGEVAREIAAPELAARHDPIVALDNLPGAQSVYGFRLAPGPRPAMVVGNERRGIAHDLQALATGAVEIPLVSSRLNCLNVAAAAAIGLYYLSRDGGGRQVARPEPASRRPELLLVGPGDQIEVGSSLRSAGAFGWGGVLIDDRAQAWFARDRATRSEGRGAARRARNPIRVVPIRPDQRLGFAEVCVVTACRANRVSTPIHRASLAKGRQQLVVIPDETRIDPAAEDWERLGKAVTFAHLDLSAPSFPYRYRLIASIALAEIARQVGRRERRGWPGRPELTYESAFDVLTDVEGEVIDLDELRIY